MKYLVFHTIISKKNGRKDINLFKAAIFFSNFSGNDLRNENKKK